MQQKISSKLVVSALACLLCVPVFAGQNKKHNLDIAYEHSKYTYREPHMAYPIKDYGSKNGISVSYMMRSLLSRDYDETDSTFGILDFRYMGGDVKYKGWVGEIDPETWEETNVTPYSQGGLDDYYFEASLKLGQTFQFTDWLGLWPYFGVGWRQLTNHGDEMEDGGYKRVQTYVYIPIGTNLKFDVGEHFAITLNGQFDWMVYGNIYNSFNNRVEFPRVGSFDSISMQQHKGYGLRASVRADLDVGKIGFFAEPFWRYWHIQNSEPWTYIFEEGGEWWKARGGFVEPFNTTHEYGFRVGITF
ncbi:MAG: hypothetical protein J6X06_04185 [Elusimicrobiaceae bacterium]|nr:hypothetical protein [Elusimicrobiaceae bacterium]